MNPEPFNDFKSVRKIKSVKHILNAVLSLILLVAINTFSAQYYMRIDLSEDSRYSLSAESKAHLRTLDKETTIRVLFPRDSNQPELEQIHLHIGHLLRSYEAAGTRDGERMLKVEYIDPFRQRSKAQAIYNKYKISDENILLVTQDERFQIIRQADLYAVKDNAINGFKGENALTSAIINVNSKAVQMIYFLTGHGEKDIYDNDPQNGLSSLRTFLENKNFKIGTLNLYQTKAVPEDASLILIVSPQGKIEAFEEELLRRYMSDRNGRMLVFLDPGRIHGMDNLFYDWGVLAENQFIFGSRQSLVSNSDDFIINQFAEHPINQLMIDYKLNAVFGQPRPILADPLSKNNKRLSVKELIGTAPETWIESDYRNQTTIHFDSEKDSPGPISIATVSNLSQTSSLGISIPSGRLGVFGNSTFIGNNHFQIFGNQLLFYNSINWILDRMHFLNIPIKPIDTYQITMNQNMAQTLLLLYSLLPIFIALWGGLILYLRKR